MDTQGNQRINATYNEIDKSIEIKPLQQGKCKIILRDLCVSTKRDTIINIEITGIGKIDVISEDKIPVNGEKILTVSLHDHVGKILSAEIVKLVKLSLLPMASDILQVTPIESTSSEVKDSRLQFKITGKRVGHAEVVFSAEGGGDRKLGSIFSSPKIITVFPPLKLSPKEITILMGNTFKVIATDGPSDADVVFSTGMNKVFFFSKMFEVFFY